MSKSRGEGLVTEGIISLRVKDPKGFRKPLGSPDEFKACAVQMFPAREEELPNPEEEVKRGRY